MKKICCEKDEVNKKNHIEKFIKNLNKKNANYNQTKFYCGEKYQNVLLIFL